MAKLRLQTMFFSIVPCRSFKSRESVKIGQNFNQKFFRSLSIDMDMVLETIENLKHNEMLDPLGQAWQSGIALAA